MYDGMDVWEISIDLFVRCNAIEKQWFQEQREPLTDYQVGQCDTLMQKIARAIMTTTGEMQDELYRKLGDFQEAMMNGGN